MTIGTDTSSGVLRISGILDIDAASGLREALLTCLQEDAEIAVDLSCVDAIDTAALQVLLAGQKSAASRGKSLRVVAAGDCIVNTAAALGLTIDVSTERHEDGHGS